MNRFSFKANGITQKEFWIPTGRYDITYKQWNEAYPFIQLADEAMKDFEAGNTLDAQRKSIESICRVIAALSKGITYEELIMVEWDKINNLFVTQFAFLQREAPKEIFEIKGRKFSIRTFEKGTAGDFMDCTDLLKQIEQSSEIDKGILIAAVYLRDGEYYQDLQAIEERISWLKEHARMDVIYACSFFLLNFMRKWGESMQRHSAVVAELEKGMSTLNAWVTTLYLQTLRPQAFSPTPK